MQEEWFANLLLFSYGVLTKTSMIIVFTIGEKKHNQPNMIDTRTAPQFLADDIYLPGWMLVQSVDYSKDSGVFTFSPREPEVARGSIVSYVTPRGLHVLISQAAYCLMENQAEEGRLNIPTQDLRKLLLGSRVKITELYERFRREIEMLGSIEGKVTLTTLRLGRIPIARFDFDFGERAIVGNLTTAIAHNPITPINADVVRI